MEKHGLALATLALLALGGCTRPPLRGAVPLAGDGQSSWIYVETRDADRNGIWWCTAPAEGEAGPPRCLKAELHQALQHRAPSAPGAAASR